jgi:hypothetical protein
MAENQPPANASPPPNTPLQDRSIALSVLPLASSIVRATLGNANGNHRGRSKPAKTAVQEAETEVVLERKNQVFAERNLAAANLRVANLWELNEKRNLDLAQLTTDNKCLSDLLKSQKTLFKMEIDVEKAHTTSKVQMKKEAVKAVTSSKQALKRDFDKQKKAYHSLLGTSNTNKVKISDLNCTQSSLMWMRTDLQNEVKSLVKEVKWLTKKIDNQLDKKLNHELSMQKMRNEYKQLDIDQACKKIENKKAVPSKAASAALSLEDKKELESHKVDCKRRTKDDNFARNKMKKGTKAQDVQSNLGFAANMLQNTLNMNGGMWQTGSVRCKWLIVVFLFLSLFLQLLTHSFKSFSTLIATNQQHLAQRPAINAADAMHQRTMTQCYNSTGPTPGVQAVAGMPTPSPILPAHISCVPPGFHYFAMNGMAYF